MTDNKQEIENLLIEYLNEYEALTTLREQYNDNLKNGYFLITKSRYSMGQKSLGQLQYPESMKSTFNLSMPTSDLKYEEKDNNFISIHYKNNSSTSNENNNNNNTSTYSKNNSTSNSASTATTTTTRRRNIPSNPTITTTKDGVTTMGSLESLLKNNNINQDYGSSDDSDSDNDSDNDSDDSDSDNNINENDQDKKKDKILKKKLKENKKIIKKDPLYWFGIMTPQSLKQSQNYFKQAISQSIEISNKLIKMDLIYKQYIALLDK